MGKDATMLSKKNIDQIIELILSDDRVVLLIEEIDFNLEEIKDNYTYYCNHQSAHKWTFDINKSSNGKNIILKCKICKREFRMILLSLDSNKEKDLNEEYSIKYINTVDAMPLLVKEYSISSKFKRFKNNII